jgi:hypothetical protein
MASGRLRLQLLGFFLDPLAVGPHPQDFALNMLRSLFARLDRELIFAHAQLVAGIPSPVEQLLRRCLRLRQKRSPPKQR